jgi:hypothetical protein
MSADRPVNYDWRRKNLRGISTTDEARARTWIRVAMQQGYGVFGMWGRNGSGGGMGSIRSVRERQARLHQAAAAE